MGQSASDDKDKSGLDSVQWVIKHEVHGKCYIDHEMYMALITRVEVASAGHFYPVRWAGSRMPMFYVNGIAVYVGDEVQS